MSPDQVPTDVLRHCFEIDRCNQRGGRMLSIVDLIDAGTITREAAGYCLAAIGRGASFLVGAVPGGAGKTTVMGALLNFVPARVRLRPADGLDAIRRALAAPEPRCCYICHEIGRGPYYAYLWGSALRAYFELPAAGHMVATNLHADTYQQARDQICVDNGISPEALRRIGLMLFLDVRRTGGRIERTISAIWESDGVDDHHRVFPAEGRAEAPIRSKLVSAEAIAEATRRLDALVAAGARTIEEVRAAICAWQRGCE